MEANNTPVTPNSRPPWVVRLLRPLRAVTASMQPSRLVIGLVLVAALMTIGSLWDAATQSVPPEGLLGERMLLPTGEAVWPAEPAPDAEPERIGPFEATLSAAAASFHRLVRGVIELEPIDVYESLANMAVRIPAALWRHDPVFLIGYGLLALILKSLLGGALCRLAALQAGLGENPRMQEGLVFAGGAWMRFVAAPLLPLLAVLFALAFILILGLLLLVPVIDLLGALLYGLALATGLLAVFVLIGTIFAAPLLSPAVACENCDAAEAVQRGFAYLFQRPVTVLALYVVCLIGLAVGFLVVATVAAATLNLTNAVYGAWNPASATALSTEHGPFRLFVATPAPDSGLTAPAAAAIMGFWQTLLAALVGGWVFSYACSSLTLAYLSAREAADGQDPEEIWMPGRVRGGSVPTTPTAGAPSAPVSSQVDAAEGI